MGRRLRRLTLPLLAALAALAASLRACTASGTSCFLHGQSLMPSFPCDTACPSHTAGSALEGRASALHQRAARNLAPSGIAEAETDAEGGVDRILSTSCGSPICLQPPTANLVVAYPRNETLVVQVQAEEGRRWTLGATQRLGMEVLDSAGGFAVRISTGELEPGTWDWQVSVFDMDDWQVQAFLPISVQVVAPAAVLVPSDAIDQMALPGGRVNITMDIMNDGTAPLDWSAEVVPDPAVPAALQPAWGVRQGSPVNGTVPPMSSHPLHLFADTGNLTKGLYTSSVVVTTSDPLHTPDPVEWRVRVANLWVCPTIVSTRLFPLSEYSSSVFVFSLASERQQRLEIDNSTTPSWLRVLNAPEALPTQATPIQLTLAVSVDAGKVNFPAGAGEYVAEFGVINCPLDNSTAGNLCTDADPAEVDRGTVTVSVTLDIGVPFPATSTLTLRQGGLTGAANTGADLSPGQVASVPANGEVYADIFLRDAYGEPTLRQLDPLRVAVFARVHPAAPWVRLPASAWRFVTPHGSATRTVRIQASQAHVLGQLSLEVTYGGISIVGGARDRLVEIMPASCHAATQVLESDALSCRCKPGLEAPGTIPVVGGITIADLLDTLKPCRPCQRGQFRTDVAAAAALEGAAAGAGLAQVPAGQGNGTLPPNDLSTTASAALLAQSCQPCRGNTFSHVGASECMQCPPRGAACSGGLLSLRDGWWLTNDVGFDDITTSTPIYPCINFDACQSVAANISLSAAAPAGQSVVECATGHTGALCFACDAGWLRVFGSCVTCWSPAGASLASLSILLVSILVPVLALHLMRVPAQAKQGLPAPRSLTWGTHHPALQHEQQPGACWSRGCRSFQGVAALRGQGCCGRVACRPRPSPAVMATCPGQESPPSKDQDLYAYAHFSAVDEFGTHIRLFWQWAQLFSMLSGALELAVAPGIGRVFEAVGGWGDVFGLDLLNWVCAYGPTRSAGGDVISSMFWSVFWCIFLPSLFATVTGAIHRALRPPPASAPPVARASRQRRPVQQDGVEEDPTPSGVDGAGLPPPRPSEQGPWVSLYDWRSSLVLGLASVVGCSLCLAYSTLARSVFATFDTLHTSVRGEHLLRSDVTQSTSSDRYAGAMAVAVLFGVTFLIAWPLCMVWGGLVATSPSSLHPSLTWLCRPRRPASPAATSKPSSDGNQEGVDPWMRGLVDAMVSLSTAGLHAEQVVRGPSAPSQGVLMAAALKLQRGGTDVVLPPVPRDERGDVLEQDSVSNPLTAWIVHSNGRYWWSVVEHARVLWVALVGATLSHPNEQVLSICCVLLLHTLITVMVWPYASRRSNLLATSASMVHLCCVMALHYTATSAAADTNFEVSTGREGAEAAERAARESNTTNLLMVLVVGMSAVFACNIGFDLTRVVLGPAAAQRVLDNVNAALARCTCCAVEDASASSTPSPLASKQAAKEALVARRPSTRSRAVVSKRPASRPLSDSLGADDLEATLGSSGLLSLDEPQPGRTDSLESSEQ